MEGNATLSDVMMRLAERGLVDRDIDVTGSSYRIDVTAEGDLARERGLDCIRGIERG